ncbi:MAG TPA: hypothetical protein VLV18_03440 [Terriglobales bacterium]|nr:hypothetical protein [Terriglobales bacterium]
MINLKRLGSGLRSYTERPYHPYYPMCGYWAWPLYGYAEEQVDVS